MTYKKWERALKRELFSAPKPERDRTLEFYREMKEEKTLHGETEDAITAEFGAPAACAEKVLQANGISARRRISPAEAIGLFFASLLLILPLLAVMASVVLSFAAVSLSGAAVSLAGVVFAFGAPFFASGANVAAYVGMGIAGVGCGVLLCVGFFFATKYAALGLRAFVRAVYVRR